MLMVLDYHYYVCSQSILYFYNLAKQSRISCSMFSLFPILPKSWSRGENVIEILRNPRISDDDDIIAIAWLEKELIYMDWKNGSGFFYFQIC